MPCVEALRNHPFETEWNPYIYIYTYIYCTIYKCIIIIDYIHPMSCKVEYLKLDFSPPKSVDWMETHQQSRRMAMEVKMRRRWGRVGGSNVKWNFTAQVSRPQRFTKQVLLVKGVMIQIVLTPGPLNHTWNWKGEFSFSPWNLTIRVRTIPCRWYRLFLVALPGVVCRPAPAKF